MQKPNITPSPPTLPALPWRVSPLPDYRGIIHTGDGHCLLNLEGLGVPPETAADLKRAIAALPDLLMALEVCHAFIHELQTGGYCIDCDNERDVIRAALTKSGYTF